MSVFTRDDGRTAVEVRIPTQRSALDRVSSQPPSRANRSVRSMALAVDAVTVSAALVVAGVIRDLTTLLPASSTEYVPRLVIAAPLLGLGWLVAIWLLGGYQHAIFGAGADEYKRVFNAGFVTAAVIGVACYLARFELSRGFFVLALLVGTALVLTGRVALRRAVRGARRKGSLLHRVLIVGTPAQVDDVAEVLARESWLGYDVVGALTPGTPPAQTKAGVAVLGSTRSIVQTASEVRADVVFLAGGAVESAVEMRKLAWELESSSTQVVVAPSVTDVSRERISIRPVGGLPLLHLEKPRSAAAVRRAKRLFDVTGAFFLLLLFSPVFAVAAVQVWRCDRGPILFRQERIGRDGKPFDCLKFRTMVLDAESLLDALHKEHGLDGGAFAKIKQDPRVTAPGRWLRRFSVDELPQLVNVLRGDMSLVGPRPQVAREVALYDSAMSRRLRVRPGMTGLWQVSGRSDLSVSEAMRLDLYYVDNWSMMQDLIILAKTFSAVVGSQGAY